MQSTHVIRRTVLGALPGTLVGGRPTSAADVTLLNVSLPKRVRNGSVLMLDQATTRKPRGAPGCQPAV